MARGGFLDISKEGSKKLDWDSVTKLSPLVPFPTPSARGMIRYRTNSHFMRRYRYGRRCIVEALVFATGMSASELNLTGFNGSQYDQGIELKEVSERLQASNGPPFELMQVRSDGSTCGGAGGRRNRNSAVKRTLDGTERRIAWDLHSLISLTEGIYVAIAQVDNGEGPADAHAIVWDAWRRVIFFGPGDFNEHVCDGAIVVEQEDIDDKEHRSDVYIGVEQEHAKMTLSEYVHTIFGISRVTKVAAVMVKAKCASETGYV